MTKCTAPDTGQATWTAVSQSQILTAWERRIPPHAGQGHMGVALQGRVNQQGLWKALFVVERG